MEKTKIGQLREAVANKDYKTAFSIASKFFTGLTKEEQRSIGIAHEANNPQRRKFYEGLDVNVDACIEDAKEIINKKYIINQTN